MSNVGSVGGSSAANLSPSTTPAAETPAAATPVTLGSNELRANPAISALAASGGSVGFGARSDAARAIQTQLVNMGWLAGGVTSADGVYGRKTQTAVAEFQRAYGLPASGNVDPATLAALDRALQVGAKKPAPGARPNEIVFVGMGKDTAHEVRDLQRRGVAVHGINDTPENDKVTLRAAGGRVTTHDLTTAEGRAGFVSAIGLSGAKATEAAAIIDEAGDDARDEVALTIKAFAEAERGQRTIERLVLSGHSVGGGVWGDDNGYFELDTLRKVTKAFPRAAAQVQDFLIAGCYSSSERHVQQFREIFPKLKTSMAYGDSAPGTWSGAMVHNQRWEAATRGNDPTKLTRDLFAGTRKGENVATWNAIDGYRADGPQRPLADLRADLARTEGPTRAFFSGDQNVTDTQAGPLRDHYRAIQQLLGSAQLPAGERPGLEAKRDATIRMIFFDSMIKGKFQEVHGAAVGAGFQALGLQAPNFAQLSRKDALAQIARFEQALAARNPKPQAALAAKTLLVDGLRDLKASVIPNTWV